MNCKQQVQLGQFEMNCTSEYICRTAQIHRSTYTYLHVTCKLIYRITMNVTIITIITSLLIFETVEIIAEFEIKLQLTITINIIIKSYESGQGLGVVVFVILQQTTTENYIIRQSKY